MNFNFKFIYLLIVLIFSNCSYFNINLNQSEENLMKSLSKSIKIKEIKYIKDADRIFVNTFYDMIGIDKKLITDSKVFVDISLDYKKMMSGFSQTGTILQYQKNLTVSYVIKIKTKQKRFDKKEKIQKEIEDYYIISNGSIKVQSQYAGSIMDLFAEYTAELNAEELVANQAARELYYNVLLNLRSHVLNCRKIAKILQEKENFVKFNDQYQEKQNENNDEKTFEDIDIKNLQLIDYEIHNNACNFA